MKNSLKVMFSRYVKVLRGARQTLRCNLLDLKVNPETSLLQTANLRARTVSSNEQPKVTQNYNGISEASSICTENVPTIESKILDFATEDPSACSAKYNKTDSFGNKNITSDELATENDFEEPRGLPSALDTCNEDVSHIAPFHEPSFNFAAYANNSPTIQELAKLGVKLFKVEAKKNGMQILLRHNFEEMKPYITFLHDCGVTANEIGAFITKNPYIFTQDMDDLHTRIRYLRAHKFDQDMVARIVSNNPFWLMFATNRIDQRLGFFQQEFRLNGPQVRELATKQPKVITYNMKHIKENIFAIREEMGFNKDEVKTLVLNKPALLKKSRKKLVTVFDYLHNTMGLPHISLIRQPNILTCRLERLRQRHKYLESLGKNQYDPKKPLYVSNDAIVGGTDVEFCRDVANTTVDTYNLYLKSL